MEIVITGASGFLGTALIERFVNDGYIVKALGHSEKKTVEGSKLASWNIGDITNTSFCRDNIKGDICIHAAAQKHIPIAENNPEFSILNNIVGTLNVFKAAIDNKIKEVIFISTDKAFEPETIYGKTKEFGEWLCNYYNTLQQTTKFYCCRYGNVAGSSGSVFEIWDKLGREGKTISVTSREMTRFFFTIDDAVDTVVETLNKKDVDNIYVPDMKAMLMGDVADIFSDHYKIGIDVIGLRCTEKLHEAMSKEYSSDTCSRYTKEEIVNFLKSIGCLK